MVVTRIVPNLPVADVAAALALYSGLFDLAVGMDAGWVGSVGPAGAPAVQLQTITRDTSAPCNPAVSVGVSTTAELDAVAERVRTAGLGLIYPPTDEPWGVRRFFFRDPDGNVVNVVAHR